MATKRQTAISAAEKSNPIWSLPTREIISVTSGIVVACKLMMDLVYVGCASLVLGYFAGAASVIWLARRKGWAKTLDLSE